jgi:peptide deformylase
MAILNILHFPDPRLRERSTEVAAVDDRIRTLIDDMLETMYEAPGIGLAAPQVNVRKRVIVVDVSEDRSAPLSLINPVIRSHDGTTEYEEGCLSVPGYSDKITRAESIVVDALDRNGTPIEISCDGLLAICIQHEIDHLNGKLFVDYLSSLKRQRIRKRLEKQQRSA